MCATGIRFNRIALAAFAVALMSRRYDGEAVLDAHGRSNRADLVELGLITYR